MKHLEPKPQLLANPPSIKALPNKRSLKTKFTIAAFALILGVGGIMTAFWDPTPSDNVTETTKTRLVNEFPSTLPVKLTAVAPHETGAAMDSMALDPSQRNSLMQTLNTAASKNSLGWIEVWDFASQDGDIVHISSAGFELDYPILNTPARIAIPIDATAIVRISGVRDGGGGITLGIKNGISAISLPVIQPGETLTVPITF